MVAFVEAGLIIAAALILGGILVSGLLVLGGDLLARQTGLLLQPRFGFDEIALVLGGAFLVAALAAAFPALRASHTQIEELLQS
jgi:ABC-type antimicrobial peptide transport system permease subunit